MTKFNWLLTGIIAALLLALVVVSGDYYRTDRAWAEAYGTQAQKYEDQVDQLTEEQMLQLQDEYYKGNYDMCLGIWGYLGINDVYSLCLRAIQKSYDHNWYNQASPGYISPVMRQLRLSNG